MLTFQHGPSFTRERLLGHPNKVVAEDEALFPLPKNMAITKRDVARAAKLRGLTFNSSAVEPIVRTLQSEMNPAESLQAILDNVKAHLESNPGKFSRIEYLVPAVPSAAAPLTIPPRYKYGDNQNALRHHSHHNGRYHYPRDC